MENNVKIKHLQTDASTKYCYMFWTFTELMILTLKVKVILERGKSRWQLDYYSRPKKKIITTSKMLYLGMKSLLHSLVCLLGISRQGLSLKICAVGSFWKNHIFHTSSYLSYMFFRRQFGGKRLGKKQRIFTFNYNFYSFVLLGL